jgi:hypothetical protein
MCRGAIRRACGMAEGNLDDPVLPRMPGTSPFHVRESLGWKG